MPDNSLKEFEARLEDIRKTLPTVEEGSDEYMLLVDEYAQIKGRISELKLANFLKFDGQDIIDGVV